MRSKWKRAKKDEKMMRDTLRYLEKRGIKALEFARRAILSESIGAKNVHDALNYFMNEVWFDFYYPGLLSIACEAVGGDSEKTVEIGAGIVLMRGAIDIHDDIIDQSKTKDSKLTVYGTYGKDVSLLTGDALLLKSFTLLAEGSRALQEEKRQRILTLLKSAFFEVGDAEAREILFRGRFDLTPEEYFEVVRLKAASADVSARIGAIIGDGIKKEVRALGEYGRILGILMIIRNEFVDMFESEELQNRIANECLPLPILYAFKNKNSKEKIINILQKKKLTKKDVSYVVDTIFETKEVEELREEMRRLIKKGLDGLECLRNLEVKNILNNLLLLSVRDLE